MLLFMTRTTQACVIFAGVLFFLPILPAYSEQPAAKTHGTGTAMNVTSSAFQAEAMIPSKYTCEGGNVSPPLTWTGVPTGTKSLALICDDPDAPGGPFVHWVLYNLPASTTALAERVATTPILPGGARQGMNGFDKIGYGGPCPPEGKAHHYFFKLYALDSGLAVKPGATKKEVEQAMEHHILAEGLLMGKYQRKK